MDHPCTCGHAVEEHGGDPKYPGSTACSGEVDYGGGYGPQQCDCIAYEADEDA